MKNDYNARGLFYSGPLLGALVAVKWEALQRYRDHLSGAGPGLADLIAEEGWPHERWRRWRRRPALAPHGSARVEPVLDAWRAPSGVPKMADRAPVRASTRWTLDDVVREPRERPLDPTEQEDG